jgi:YggT family protein
MPAKLILLLAQAIDIYGFLLFAWAIASWFPNFQNSKLYHYLDAVTGPYIKMFRDLIPPLGGFDLSVILACFVLYLAKSILLSLF